VPVSDAATQLLLNDFVHDFFGTDVRVTQLVQFMHPRMGTDAPVTPAPAQVPRCPAPDADEVRAYAQASRDIY
jgi:hypothetical protein